jgi:hypothetical protein
VRQRGLDEVRATYGSGVRARGREAEPIHRPSCPDRTLLAMPLFGQVALSMQVPQPGHGLVKACRAVGFVHVFEASSDRDNLRHRGQASRFAGQVRPSDCAASRAMRLPGSQPADAGIPMAEYLARDCRWCRNQVSRVGVE